MCDEEASDEDVDEGVDDDTEAEVEVDEDGGRALDSPSLYIVLIVRESVGRVCA